MTKTPAEVKAEMTSIYKQMDEEIELTDDQRMKVLMTFAGTIEGLHTKLDYVRDVIDEHDARNPIDHNIEQAQIALENAAMRLQQVSNFVIDRMERTTQEDLEEKCGPLFIARLEGRATLGGIANQLGISEAEAEQLFNRWIEARKEVRKGFDSFGNIKTDTEEQD